MPKPRKPADLFKAYQKKVSFIDNYLGDFDVELKQLQRELAMKIVAEFMPKLSVKDGYIEMSKANGLLLGELDSIMNRFKETFATNVFKGTAETMLGLTGLSSDYFRRFNFGAKTLSNIEKKLERMQYTIGLDSKGRVLKGSFIDNLASTPQAKSLLSDYVRNGIEGEMKYNDFVKGFKELVEGTAETNGALVKYAESYVHDSVFSHSRAVDSFFADELGIDCFYYAGDAVKTSRDFCLERMGQVFKREEVDSWSDQDWQGKIPGEDVWISLGGYNCRHNLMPVPCDYVTEDEMNKADPNT